MVQQIALRHPYLQYTGRIDDSSPSSLVFEWVAASVRLILKGRVLRLRVSNRTNYFESRLGVIINGTMQAILLPEKGEMTVDLSEYLTESVNDVLIYKRQDASHQLTLHSLEIDGELLPPPERPARRIEFYGDSVTAGEVTEADHCVGQPDPPDHKGLYSNSWWGYAWQTARLLGAEMHNCGQGGIAVQDQRGWFNGPDYVGMLSCYDKVRYNPCFGASEPWDFSRWTPHVVVVAIGQNDANPGDFMRDDENGSQAAQWRADYRRLLEQIRSHYPHAVFVLTTTILNHDAAWDRAIDRVCREMQQDGLPVHHFLYSKNGCGTPGHIRKSEAAVMAQELSSFINSLGEDVWHDA